MSRRPLTAGIADDASMQRHEDSGVILVFVLVAVILISMVSIPILSYVRTVFRAQEVQADRAQSTELANGGVWVALSNEEDLYDICPEIGQPAAALTSSLAEVTVSCQLLDEEQLRPANEVPFEASTVQADEELPGSVASATTYTNPSTSANPSAWLADRASTPTENTVWIPQLPVKVGADGVRRDTSMPPNTFDATHGTECRVFFPGTFESEVVLDSPTYFTSGVYYFTEPIVLQNGAHVVVGNGAEAGCTNDFEAVALARSVPESLNMSGLGGTFILGDNARITIDDGSGDAIFFAINQRYVSNDETSVAASSDVAIISVNGAHAPFLPNETLGMPMYLPGVLDVPASTVDSDGDPLASDSGYLPSTLTPRPDVPDAPVIASVADFRMGSEGRVAVAVSPTSGTGLPILYYEATDSVTGQTCRTATPIREALDPVPGCTLRNIPDGTTSLVSVVAVNAVGASAPSSQSSATVSTSTSPVMSDPTPSPTSVSVSAVYADGIGVSWSNPNQTTGAAAGVPITYTVVTAVETTTSDVVTCQAWWTDTSCVLTTAGGLVDGGVYDVTVESLVVDGDFDVVYSAQAPDVSAADDYAVTLGGAAAPVAGPGSSSVRTRSAEAILDFTTSTSTEVDVIIDGYVAIPQGHIDIDAHEPGRMSIEISGGLVAGAFDVDGVPSDFDVFFDNPIAQKRIRIVSDVVDTGIRADTVVQVNRSGSLAINSWVVGPSNDATTAAPGDAPPPPGGADDEPDEPYVDPYTGGGDPGVDYSADYPTSTPPTPTPAACGASEWEVSTWQNTTLTGDPFDEDCDSGPNVNWGNGAGPTGDVDGFSVRWTKTINVPTTGDYEITLGADDGVRLRIDGNLVHDDWVNGGYVAQTITENLTAGDHVFQYDFYEDGGEAQVSFQMVALTPALTCDGATPWIASYWNNVGLSGDVELQECVASVDDQWNGSGPIDAQDENFSASYETTIDVASTSDYQFTIGADDGIRIFVDNAEIYGDWTNQSYSTVGYVQQLNAGQRVIRVEYYNATLEGRVLVEFEPVGAPAPSPVLFQDADDATKTGDVQSDGTGFGWDYSGNVNDSSGPDTSRGAIAFTFTVTDAGNYLLRGSVKAVSSGNSFWVSVNGGSAWRWDSTVTGGYANSSVTNAQLEPLAAGQHTVTLYMREDDKFIDWLELVAA